ncbi:MAG: hypothetical protein RBS80_11510 [Thermoguttaceae bacterium]|nr:hypothetical protein [Thermoguttaceae bacterium]
MNVLRNSLLFLGLAALAASTAYGQYGLYGSPDLVPLSAGNITPTVSQAAHPTPAFQPLMARQQPQPGWQQPQPTYQATRQPLLRPAPAVPQYMFQQPQYAVPQHGAPQYGVPRYAASPYNGPRHPAPGMVKPHPAVAGYYAPEVPQPGEQLQQAIPVPPAPPGMAEPSPSPSDQLGPPAMTGGVPSAGGYLDYDPGWGYCGAPPQTSSFQGSPYDGGCGCGSSGYGCGFGCQDRSWYGGAMALFLGRNNANRLWTTYEHGHFANQLMHSDMIGLQWRAGGEVKLGYRFGCGCCDTGCGCDIGYGYEKPWALQATYFTIDPFSGYHRMTHANHVSSVLTLGNVYFHGWGANNWFDNALEHQLWRRNEIHNVEVSFVRSNLPWFYSGRFDCDFEFGVRYFRFWEHLTFGTLASPNPLRPGVNRAFLEDKVSNNLVGFQLGLNMGYHFHPSCRIYAAPKFGIYNNHIDHYFIARLSDGTVGTVVDPPGESFPARSSTNALSFLTQIDVGLDWLITERLSAQIGYRVIVATGMALADHQIPHLVNDIPEIRHIDRNGELVLHGAFAGLTFNY